MKFSHFFVLILIIGQLLAGCEFLRSPSKGDSGDEEGESRLGLDGIPGSPEMKYILPTFGNSKMARSSRYRAVISMNNLSARTLSQGRDYMAGDSELEPLIDILIGLSDDDFGRLDSQYQ